jgi:tetratricopeptide (TPR) repeat protein
VLRNCLGFRISYFEFVYFVFRYFVYLLYLYKAVVETSHAAFPIFNTKTKGRKMKIPRVLRIIAFFTCAIFTFTTVAQSAPVEELLNRNKDMSRSASLHSILNNPYALSLSALGAARDLAPQPLSQVIEKINSFIPPVTDPAEKEKAITTEELLPQAIAAPHAPHLTRAEDSEIGIDEERTVQTQDNLKTDKEMRSSMIDERGNQTTQTGSKDQKTSLKSILPLLFLTGSVVAGMVFGFPDLSMASEGMPVSAGLMALLLGPIALAVVFALGVVVRMIFGKDSPQTREDIDMMMDEAQEEARLMFISPQREIDSRKDESTLRMSFFATIPAVSFATSTVGYDPWLVGMSAIGLLVAAMVMNITRVFGNPGFDPYKVYDEARQMMEEGDVAGGIKKLEDALSVEPLLAPLWFLLGHAHATQKSYDQSIEAYEKGLEVHYNPTASRELAQVRFLKENVDTLESEKAHYEAAMSGTESADQLYAAGKKLFEDGAFSNAISSFLGAVHIDPAHAPSRRALADYYRDRGVQLGKKNEYKRATSEFEESLKYEDRDTSELYMFIGANYFNMGQIDEAIIALQKSLDSRPDYVESLEYLVRSYAVCAYRDGTSYEAAYRTLLKIMEQGASSPQYVQFKEELEELERQWVLRNKGKAASSDKSKTLKAILPLLFVSAIGATAFVIGFPSLSLASDGNAGFTLMEEVILFTGVVSLLGLIIFVSAFLNKVYLQKETLALLQSDKWNDKYIGTINAMRGSQKSALPFIRQNLEDSHARETLILKSLEAVLFFKDQEAKEIVERRMLFGDTAEIRKAATRVYEELVSLQKLAVYSVEARVKEMSRQEESNTSMGSLSKKLGLTGALVLGLSRSSEASESLASLFSKVEPQWLAVVGVLLSGYVLLKVVKFTIKGLKLAILIGAAVLFAFLAPESFVSPEKALSQKMETYISQLASSKSELALKARTEIEKIGRDALPALRAAAEHPDKRVRAYVAEILGTMGDLKEKQVLVKMLSDYDKDVRAQAERALKSMGELTSELRLKKALADLKDNYSSVQDWGESVIKKYGDPSHVPLLEEALKNEFSEIQGKLRSLIETIKKKENATPEEKKSDKKGEKAPAPVIKKIQLVEPQKSTEVKSILPLLFLTGTLLGVVLGMPDILLAADGIRDTGTTVGALPLILGLVVTIYVLWKGLVYLFEKMGRGQTAIPDDLIDTYDPTIDEALNQFEADHDSPFGRGNKQWANGLRAALPDIIKILQEPATPHIVLQESLMAIRDYRFVEARDAVLFLAQHSDNQMIKEDAEKTLALLDLAKSDDMTNKAGATDASEQCPDCDGNGVIFINVTGGYPVSEKCSACNGKGRIEPQALRGNVHRSTISIAPSLQPREVTSDPLLERELAQKIETYSELLSLSYKERMQRGLKIEVESDLGTLADYQILEHGATARIAPITLKNQIVFEGALTHEFVHHLLLTLPIGQRLAKKYGAVAKLEKEHIPTDDTVARVLGTRHYRYGAKFHDLIATVIELRAITVRAFQEDLAKGKALGETFNEVVAFLNSSESRVTDVSRLHLKHLLNHFRAVEGAPLEKQILVVKELLKFRVYAAEGYELFNATDVSDVAAFVREIEKEIFADGDFDSDFYTMENAILSESEERLVRASERADKARALLIDAFELKTLDREVLKGLLADDRALYIFNEKEIYRAHIDNDLMIRMDAQGSFAVSTLESAVNHVLSKGYALSIVSRSSDKARFEKIYGRADVILFSTAYAYNAIGEKIPDLFSLEAVVFPYAFTMDTEELAAHAGVNRLFHANGKVFALNPDYVANFGETIEKSLSRIMDSIKHAVAQIAIDRAIQIAA